MWTYYYSISIKSFQRGYGLICQDCSHIKNNLPNEDGSSRNNLTEDNGIVYVRELLTDNFLIKLPDDGCLSDLALKPIKSIEDKWLMIQMKTTNIMQPDGYKFHISNKYKNCLILCMCLNDKKLWLFDGNCVTNTDSLGIGKNNSRYDQNEMKTIESLVQTINDYLCKYQLFTWNEINRPISDSHKIEQEYRQLRNSKCEFLQFEYSDRSNLVWDFTINGLKFQEKVIQQKTQNYFKANLGNYYRSKPYKKGDNDFYWFNFPDKINFMILPEKILEDHGCIKTDKQEGKTYFYFNQTEFY